MDRKQADQHNDSRALGRVPKHLVSALPDRVRPFIAMLFLALGASVAPFVAPAGASTGAVRIGGAHALKSLSPAAIQPHAAPTQGYWLVASDGGVFAFGDAPFLGSAVGPAASWGPVIGMAADSAKDGYWIVTNEGAVFSEGKAFACFALPPSGPAYFPPYATAVTAWDNGYMIVNSDGSFEHADPELSTSCSGSTGPGDYIGQGGVVAATSYYGAFLAAPQLWTTTTGGAVAASVSARPPVTFGSMAGKALSAPIVGIAGTPDQGGYWLVGADGGIFAFGDAGFYGSMGAVRLNAPIVGIAPTSDGKGYWEVASDGGIFAFGDAGFYGSMGAVHLNSPIVGIAAS